MAAVKTENNALVNTIPKYGKIILTLDNVLLPPDKLSPTPSSLDGLDAETEYDLRVQGCELIQISGILLRLPQVAMACGQVLFQRMYYAKSLVRYPMEPTAMACVALASKIEEAPRKIRDVINVFKHIRQVRTGRTLSPVILDGNYIALKNQVIKAERRLLKELGFCCHVKHPHKMIIIYLRLVEADDNRNLARTSWNYMNDALRTDVFMRYSPESIACSCIWLAARHLKVSLPENPPWYHIVSVVLEDVERIAASILKLYTRPKVKLEVLEAKVEEIRKQQQEARLRNKLLPPQQTPLQPPTTFSPGSRNQSPRSLLKLVSASSGAAACNQSKRNHEKRSGTDSSDSSGSRGSRHSLRSMTRSGHKKLRRSRSYSNERRRSRDRSRERSRDRSNDKSRDRSRERSRDRSRERSRERSRDRHHVSRKSTSKSLSPKVTPPPRFIKNKEKGSIVQSVSRSRSRSPIRTYDKYERQDKYDRKPEKYVEKNKYSEKFDGLDNKYAYDSRVKNNDKYGKLEKYCDQYDREDRKHGKLDKFEDKQNKDDKYFEKHIKDRFERNEKIDKFEKISKSYRDLKLVESLEKNAEKKGEKYVRVENLERSEKYVEKHEKGRTEYMKDEKYYSKYEVKEKNKYDNDAKKVYDNGYERHHKSKKTSRRRSESRDRRRI